jgi:hypothetical protein
MKSIAIAGTCAAGAVIAAVIGVLLLAFVKLVVG